MKENLNLKEIGKTKNGADPKKSPIANFNIKSHPIDVGDFGHYRGTFSDPEVIILADPDGYDDILTSRALTGARGQYLHTLMQGIGVNDKYLVIKTVPFGMDGATDQEWSKVLAQTATYRTKIFEELLKNGKPNLVIADGKFATEEIKKIMQGKDIPVVTIARSGTDKTAGLKEAAMQIAKTSKYKNIKFSLQMSNIPRSHLGFFARVWEGTSGDRVFNSTGASAGTAFAIVAPEWAYKQKPKQSEEERKGVLSLKTALGQKQIQNPGGKKGEDTWHGDGTDDIDHDQDRKGKNIKRVKRPKPNAA